MTKQYKTRCPSEWATIPPTYETDPEIYRDEIEKAVDALKKVEGDVLVFWYTGEAKDARFLDEDGVETDLMDCECRWEGPHLKVYKDGQAVLQWKSKYTEDEAWIDLIGYEDLQS